MAPHLLDATQISDLTGQARGIMKIIGKRNQTLRLAVGCSTARQSNVWRISAYRSDVYVSSGIKAAKFSFHKSGICRDAFTGEFGAPPGMEDRVMKRWRRPGIPPANTNGACWTLGVAFPTDFLSYGLEIPSKEVQWLDPAPSGRSRCIDTFFSLDAPEIVEQLLRGAQRVPVAAFPLEDHLWFYVSTHIDEFAGQEMRIPAAGKRQLDFEILREDVLNTGRPIRIAVTSDPQDGQKVFAWEYGAFECSSATDHRVDGVITPHQVFHSTWQ